MKWFHIRINLLCKDYLKVIKHEVNVTLLISDDVYTKQLCNLITNYSKMPLSMRKLRNLRIISVKGHKYHTSYTYPVDFNILKMLDSIKTIKTLYIQRDLIYLLCPIRCDFINIRRLYVINSGKYTLIMHDTFHLGSLTNSTVVDIGYVKPLEIYPDEMCIIRPCNPKMVVEHVINKGFITDDNLTIKVNNAQYANKMVVNKARMNNFYVICTLLKLGWRKLNNDVFSKIISFITPFDWKSTKLIVLNPREYAQVYKKHDFGYMICQCDWLLDEKRSLTKKRAELAIIETRHNRLELQLKNDRKRIIKSFEEAKNAKKKKKIKK